MQSVRERMISSLQDKRKRLEEEKGSIDITTGAIFPAKLTLFSDHFLLYIELASEMGSRLAPLRKLRRRGGVEPMDTKTAKRRVLSGARRFFCGFFVLTRVCAGPTIQHALKDNEILEDLLIITSVRMLIPCLFC